MTIELVQVSKHYDGGAMAVDRLDLVVETGTITVLVGPSGCGKTTTLRMINRMVEPTGGHVLIDGMDVATMAAHHLRRGIGYVIQSGGLFPHWRVIDNVCAVPDLLGLDRRTSRARAMDLLELVGIDASMARRFPSQLSGGQMQRVGVARALAADPPVLLMDEPFGAVDPLVRAQLQQDFLDLQRRLEKTVVFVTHDIEEAITLASRVAVMGDRGQVHQYAAPVELMARPADEFVERFLGVDRGLRLLSLLPATRLTGTALPAPIRATGDRRYVNLGSWALALSATGQPVGWSRLTGSDSDDRETPTGLLVAPVIGPQATARNALDAVVTSPSGLGVMVDDTGAAVSTIDFAAFGPLTDRPTAT